MNADPDELVRAHAETVRDMEQRVERAEAAAKRSSDLRSERDHLREELARARDAAERAEQRARGLSEQLRRVKTSRAWKLISAYRRLRTRLAPGGGRDRDDQPDMARDGVGDAAGSPCPTPSDPDRLVSIDDAMAMARFRTELDAWVQRAKHASGDDVVVMFSGTTYVQEHRGNRPIRLTNVYLERNSPVFFNFYRWSPGDELPDHHDDLLFQSPIDVTPKVLPDVLDRDFGDRRKIFYVSFPHIDAIRMMSLAKGHGWTTVYDVRDDWEAFHEVGAAAWFDPTLERWTVQTADIVTAVSEPLAEKLRIDADRADIQISPNALDSSFPSRSGRPERDERVVGYFGHLTGQWFDWELIHEAAVALPDWTFELAGHGAPADLDLPDNVVLLGPLSHSEIAERSDRWAGGMIPFKSGPVTDPLDPIKVYEYIHLRLPTVAGHYAPIAGYPGVEICESVWDFIAAVARLPQRAVDDEAAAAFLADNRWQDRVDHYMRLVDEADMHDGGRGSLDALLVQQAGPK